VAASIASPMVSCSTRSATKSVARQAEPAQRSRTTSGVSGGIVPSFDAFHLSNGSLPYDALSSAAGESNKSGCAAWANPQTA
jgi:hypothetical protein